MIITLPIEVITYTKQRPYHPSTFIHDLLLITCIDHPLYQGEQGPESITVAAVILVVANIFIVVIKTVLSLLYHHCYKCCVISNVSIINIISVYYQYCFYYQCFLSVLGNVLGNLSSKPPSFRFRELFLLFLPFLAMSFSVSPSVWILRPISPSLQNRTDQLQLK